MNKIFTTGILSLLVCATVVGTASAQEPIRARAEVEAPERVDSHVTPQGVQIKEAKEHREEARRRQIELKNTLQEAKAIRVEKKQAIVENKDAFLEARRRYQAAQEDPEVQAEYSAQAVAHLQRTISSMSARVQYLITFVEAHDAISSDIQADLLATLQGELSTLNALSARIDAGADVKEIRALATEIRNDLGRYRGFITSVIQQIKTDRFAAVQAKTKTSIEKLQKAVITFKNKGYDVTGPASILSNASVAVASADTKEELQAIFADLKQAIVLLKELRSTAAAQ